MIYSWTMIRRLQYMNETMQKNEPKPLLLNRCSKLRQLHTLARTPFAFSSSGLMFSRIIANFQPSGKDGEAEMACIVVVNMGPHAGGEEAMRGEMGRVSMVADAEKRRGVDQMETHSDLILDSSFALASALGEEEYPMAQTCPKLLYKGFDDADRKASERG